MPNQTDIPEIKKAVSVIREMNADKKLRELVYMRIKAMQDETAVMENAYKEGFVMGIAKRSEEITAKMRSMGMTDEQIGRIRSTLTDLNPNGEH